MCKLSANILKTLISARNFKEFLLKLTSTKSWKMCETTTDASIIQPPSHVFGITTLDKSLFRKSINVPYLALKNVKISTIMPHLKKYLFKIEHFKPVQTESEHTFVYLNPLTVNSCSDLPSELFDLFPIAKDSFQKKSGELNYENFNADTILKAILPKDKEGMSSYTVTGHIVHVNLREHLIPYKNVIGEVLFDKVKGCRSVVNKTDNIDNTYRNFNLEVLKGDGDMVTKVKENKCVFEFDFSKVYWNSRLCTEHSRIVDRIPSGSVVFDVFAGVGPFALPLAKKRCQVFANDLNPESFKWLNHNKKINKIQDDYFKSFNKDGRDFIIQNIKQELSNFVSKDVFILMNLPALAVEFLNAFIGLYPECKSIEKCPTIIVYCFAKGEQFEDITKNLLNEKMGVDVLDKIEELFRVRTVSSNKEMMRISLKLDREILSGEILKRPLKRKIDSNYYHGEKQAKTEERL